MSLAICPLRLLFLGPRAERRAHAAHWQRALGGASVRYGHQPIKQHPLTTSQSNPLPSSVVLRPSCPLVICEESYLLIFFEVKTRGRDENSIRKNNLICLFLFCLIVLAVDPYLRPPSALIFPPHPTISALHLHPHNLCPPPPLPSTFTFTPHLLSLAPMPSLRPVRLHLPSQRQSDASPPHRARARAAVPLSPVRLPRRTGNGICY